ncbi:MAG: ATP-binding protein [Lacibacter sp.]
MYVETLELINVRCFKHQKISLSKSINLIVGQNNSGKSTIIKTLYSLQKGGEFNFLDSNSIRVTENYLRIIFKFKDVNVLENKFFFQKDQGSEPIPYSSFQNVIFSIKSDSKKKFVIEKDYTSDITFNSQDIIDSEISNLRQNSLWYDFRVFSNREDENVFIYPFLTKRKVNNYYSTNGDDTITIYDDLRTLPARVGKLSNSSHPQNEQFIQLCDDILGFRIGVVPSEQNNSEQKLGAYVTQNSYVQLESMGEGVVNIVGLIVNLLTSDRKLYLVEELENDMHPKALKKLLELIMQKSDNNQFVISTHSNIVLKYLATANDSKVFQIKWKPKGPTGLSFGGVQVNISTSIIKEIDNDPKSRLDLLDDLGYDVFDFELFKSYLIFEESSAEKIVRDFLIPEFVPKLASKVKTIAAKGTGDLPARYIDFHRLFVYVHNTPMYKNKTWALADGDTSGRECIDKLRGKFIDWDKENFINFSETDFEKYYPSRFKNNINEALSETDKEKKREKKKLLLNEVLDWIVENREEAKKEFASSSLEIIDILKRISQKIDE